MSRQSIKPYSRKNQTPQYHDLRMKLLINILIMFCINPGRCFLLFSSPSFLHKRELSSPFSSSSSSLGCICINCAFVTNCTAYHFVEERHLQPHISKKPKFEPIDGSPSINVNIRSDQNGLWNNGFGSIKTAADLSMELEYDVVECESYAHELDSWIRNMPEEIKAVNPNFVPT